MAFKHPMHTPPATKLALAGRHLDDARRNLIEASKLLDELGMGRGGMHLFCSIDALDDCRALLTEGAPTAPSPHRREA